MSTINQCRACLEETISENSIFELNLLFNENSTSFIECFFQCTNIQINQKEKHLTQKMCDSCIQSVINMYQFRLMCQTNDLQLKSKFPKKEDIWEAEFLYNVPKLCKKPFFYEIDELEDSREDSDEKISPKMEIIEESNDSFEGSMFPEEVVKELDSSEDKLPTIEDIEKKIVLKIKCNQCKQVYFGSKPKFFNHKLTQHSKMPCIDCDEEFTTQEMNLFQEHSETHSSEYIQNCGDCKGTFTTEKELNTHDCRRVLKIAESEISGFYPCKYCERKFLNEMAFNLHIKNHMNLPLNEDEKEEYTCTDCNLFFKIKEDFTQHMRIAHVLPMRKKKYYAKSFARDRLRAEGSHLCQICGQSFKLASYVKVHMRIHTDERPYSCKFCGKRFRQTNDLKYHTTSFHGEKKYPCQLCDKKFVLPTNLKTHMRTHNNDRPFDCDVCEKSFTTSSGLGKHKNGVHLSSLKKCEICDREFTTGQLRIHMSKHTGKYLHNCQLCDYKTNRKYLMTIHSEKKHPQIVVSEDETDEDFEIN